MHATLCMLFVSPCSPVNVRAYLNTGSSKCVEIINWISECTCERVRMVQRSFPCVHVCSFCVVCVAACCRASHGARQPGARDREAVPFYACALRSFTHRCRSAFVYYFQSSCRTFSSRYIASGRLPALTLALDALYDCTGSENNALNSSYATSGALSSFGSNTLNSSPLSSVTLTAAATAAAGKQVEGNFWDQYGGLWCIFDFIRLDIILFAQIYNQCLILNVFCDVQLHLSCRILNSFFFIF